MCFFQKVTTVARKKRGKVEITKFQIIHPEDVKGWGIEKIRKYVRNNLLTGLEDTLIETSILEEFHLKNGKIKYTLKITLKE